ncbi:MAG TPA: hypothetical protein VF817_03140 [Patescibacteria group bacterium]
MKIDSLAEISTYHKVGKRPPEYLHDRIRRRLATACSEEKNEEMDNLLKYFLTGNKREHRTVFLDVLMRLHEEMRNKILADLYLYHKGKIQELADCLKSAIEKREEWFCCWFSSETAEERERASNVFWAIDAAYEKTKNM